MTAILPKTKTSVTWLCDRCSHPFTTQPGWAARPLCDACLIGLRRTEDSLPRLITAREIETAWRRATFQQWNRENTA